MTGRRFKNQERKKNRGSLPGEIYRPSHENYQTGGYRESSGEQWPAATGIKKEILAKPAGWLKIYSFFLVRNTGGPEAITLPIVDGSNAFITTAVS